MQQLIKKKKKKKKKTTENKPKQTNMKFMYENVVPSVDQSHYRIVSENGLSQCDEQICYYTVLCLTGG